MCTSSENCTDQRTIKKVFRVSNNFFRNDIVSSVELAKGYTMPLDKDLSMLVVSPEIIEAQNVINLKRNLNFILGYEAVKTPSIPVGDLVNVFVKLSHQKRGRWIGPKKL